MFDCLYTFSPSFLSQFKKVEISCHLDFYYLSNGFFLFDVFCPIYLPSTPLKQERTVGFVCLKVEGTPDFPEVILKKNAFCKTNCKTQI